MKAILKKYKKIILFLLIIVVLSRIIVATHYVSVRSSSKQWRVVCHKGLTGNPHHVWDGTLYFYGASAPDEVSVKRTIDGVKDTTYITCEKFGFLDRTSGTDVNLNRIFLNVLALSFPSGAGYSFLSEAEKPQSLTLEINWKENGEQKSEIVNLN